MQNKNEIVILNEYYKEGLRENTIINHYKKYKSYILPQLVNRYIMLFIFVEKNKYVVRRLLDAKYIQINSTNYDELLLTGRMVSVAVENCDITDANNLDYYIVDIDASLSVDEKSKKDCVTDILHVYKTMNEISRYEVVTSGTSFHVYGYSKNKMNREDAKIKLKTILSTSDIIKSKGYRIDSKIKTNIINLDLSIMNKRGSHTIPYGLALNGLMCADVTTLYKALTRGDLKI